jgi:membrane-associated protein
VFDSVANAVSGSPWTYLLIVGVCAADALLPLFPSETVVITAGVLAANGGLSIALVILAAAAGALLGDNTAYAVGNSGLRRLADRMLTSERSRQREEWGRAQLERHGVWIIIVARFIPGGRTATTYVAGTLGMPWRRRFLPADGAAACLWALYSAALGYFGGETFQHNLWLPLLLAAGVSLLVAVAGEVLRRKVLGGDEDDGHRVSAHRPNGDARGGRVPRR